MPSSWGGVLVAYAPDASPPRLAWFVTVLVTAAQRHPLKKGMEAGGIESASLPRIVGTRQDQSQHFRNVVGRRRLVPLAAIRTNHYSTVRAPGVE